MTSSDPRNQTAGLCLQLVEHILLSNHYTLFSKVRRKQGILYINYNNYKVILNWIGRAILYGNPLYRMQREKQAQEGRERDAQTKGGKCKSRKC